MERAAIDLKSGNRVTITAMILWARSSLRNIHRRHLTKEQQADLIVAAHKAAAEAADKPRQLGEVSAKGGRANVDTIKAATVAAAKEHGISKRTVERSFAKVERRIPETKKIAGPRPRRKPKLETHVGIDAARRYYLERCAEPDVDLDAERRSSSMPCARLPGSGPCRRKLTMTSATSLRVSTGADRAVRHDGRPLAYQGGKVEHAAKKAVRALRTAPDQHDWQIVLVGAERFVERHPQLRAGADQDVEAYLDRASVHFRGIVAVAVWTSQAPPCSHSRW